MNNRDWYIQLCGLSLPSIQSDGSDRRGLARGCCGCGCGCGCSSGCCCCCCCMCCSNERMRPESGSMSFSSSTSDSWVWCKNELTVDSVWRHLFSVARWIASCWRNSSIHSSGDCGLFLFAIEMNWTEFYQHWLNRWFMILLVHLIDCCITTILMRLLLVTHHWNLT